jgi:phytanoyl-CoA hydroxylase
MSLNSAFRLNIIKRHLAQTSSIPSKIQSFKYTTSGGALTDEQREQYEKDGYFVVRNLVTDESLEKYKKRFQKICSEKIKVPGMTVMKDVAIAKSEFLDGEKAITKIQDFTNDDELFEYCCLPEVTFIK